jgi:hypothetical protein
VVLDDLEEANLEIQKAIGSGVDCEDGKTIYECNLHLRLDLQRWRQRTFPRNSRNLAQQRPRRSHILFDAFARGAASGQIKPD